MASRAVSPRRIMRIRRYFPERATIECGRDPGRRERGSNTPNRDQITTLRSESGRVNTDNTTGSLVKYLHVPFSAQMTLRTRRVESCVHAYRAPRVVPVSVTDSTSRTTGEVGTFPPAGSGFE